MRTETIEERQARRIKEREGFSKLNTPREMASFLGRYPWTGRPSPAIKANLQKVADYILSTEAEQPPTKGEIAFAEKVLKKAQDSKAEDEKATAEATAQDAAEEEKAAEAPAKKTKRSKSK